MIVFAQQTWFINWEIALAVGALIGVVALGTWAIYKAKEWREETAQDAPLSRHELLKHYQELVDAGSLDQEEFDRIKAELTQNPADIPVPQPKDQPPDTSIRES
jgi:hypothetical protein